MKDGNNQNHKNKIRNIIVDLIRAQNISRIITLESPEFIFSKALPDKKIIVFENNSTVFKKMEKKCPKNVELIWGNIGKFGVLNAKTDFIWLDFCRTWMSEKENIALLKETLKEVKYLAITLCLRESKYHQDTGNVFSGDYQFDLINKIQSITEINWKVIYGESYYDSVQMVTIILKNGDKF
jgi:hypothetical protein